MQVQIVSDNIQLKLVEMDAISIQKGKVVWMEDTQDAMAEAGVER
jgi:hypothetical protein